MGYVKAWTKPPLVPLCSVAGPAVLAGAYSSEYEVPRPTAENIASGRASLGFFGESPGFFGESPGFYKESQGIRDKSVKNDS